MAFTCSRLSVGAFQIVAWFRAQFIDGMTRSQPVNKPLRPFEMHPLSVVTTLLFLGLVFPAVLPGQIAPAEALTIDHGLSQGMVYDLLQTRDGFLWIGTKDGLNRYDGHHFRVWSNDPYHPYTLSDNTVTALFEDSRGWLWIGNESQVVHLMDRKRERFYQISLPAISQENKEVSYDVRCIKEDKSGHIWIVNRAGGLYRLSIPDTWKDSLPDTPDLSILTHLTPVQIPNNQQGKKGLQEEFIDICILQDGNICLGSSKGMYLVDPRTLQVKRIPMQAHYPQEAGSLLQTNSGAIWGASRNKIFTYQAGKFNYLSVGDNQEIGTTPVLQIDKSGGIWILFETKLWYLTDMRGFDPANPDYVLDRPGNTLTLDIQGNIWVGSLGYGLRKITPRKSVFRSSLPGTSIWGVWQDHQGRILCKLFNKIVAFDPITNQLSRQSAFPDAPPQQNDLLFEASGDMWLLCGLREGVVNTSQLRRYRPDRSLAAVYDIDLDRYPYARLLRTADACIWVSGTSGRLLRCNPATGQITRFDFGQLFGEQAPAVLTFALVEDGNGVIWAGTQMGLVKGVWVNNSLDFQLIKANAQQKTGLNNNSIACLLPDPKEPHKRLWIGTKGGGINCLDLQTGKFSYITTNQGLPNNVVYGIVPDQSGRLWCSTNRGLARISLHEAIVKNIQLFNHADGLQSNEFNTQAFFKAPSGELLFGGINGLNRFLPESLQLNTLAPSVCIVGLEINHQPAYFSDAEDSVLPTPVEYLRQITLQAGQNNLSFEFAALDFTDPAKNRYRYQLLPIEEDWVDAGEEHFAHYTHLAPGNYVFRVLGSNNDGAWNDIPVEMGIEILPPWWQTRLAWFIYFLIIAAIIWRIHLAQAHSIRLQEQVAFEQRESVRMRALEQMKTNFFSNITHEFRTPLTLIIEPLRQVLKNPNADNWLSKVQLAARNSHKMLHLVNELLDLAKLESGAMRPEYRTGYIGDILRPVAESFAGAAESKNVQLQLSIPENDIYGSFDEDKLEKICFNLVSNALKFTPSGGLIQVTAGLYTAKNTEKPPIDTHPENCLIISVKDNGKGIAPADLPNIFDRFYQANDVPDRGQIGTGVGLALSRELAELMDGKITVESQIGQGTVFYLWLPLLQGNAENTAPAIEKKDAQIRQSVDYQEQLSHVNVAAGENKHDAGQAQDTVRPLLLLAEDNDELRSFLTQTLSGNYEVIAAPDGKEAIELARQRVPDIVVSDIFMPHVDGIGLLDKLKTDVVTSHIPVLLLTSKTALESRLKGLQHGADAYLGKPFHTEELLAWLRNLLESRRRLQEKFVHDVPLNIGNQSSISDSLDTGVQSSGTFMGALDQAFLEKLRQVAEQEIENENLSVEDVARHMNMSRSQLHRKLSAITAQSAGEFLRNYRLDRAMELLRAQSGNVSEIAWRVGFSNPKYFSTTFKERFGISPSEV